MSTKTVKEFYEKVAMDESIQEKIKEVDRKREESFQDSLKEMVEIAKAEGFVFSTEDFIEARKEVYLEEVSASKVKENKKEWEPCWLASGCAYGIWTPKPNDCGQGVAHIPPAPEIPDE